MKKIIFSTLFFLSLTNLLAQTISGELKKWHKIVLSSEIVTSDLSESEATFKNHRVDVIFTAPNNDELRVPGFFDADGDPANTSSKTGKIFKAILRPNQIGEWTYKILYYTGTDVALMKVSDLPAPTTEQTGSVGTIIANDKQLPDLRAQGRLIYKTTGTDNERRYLQFSETGEYFLKFGPDSPENMFDYNEFDRDVPRSGCFFCKEHQFKPHEGQYLTGDPTWNGGKGKNIIGALNYLKIQKMNSMSLSLFGGDDRDVHPWISRADKYIFDVSKLAQWEIVLSHAEQNGLVTHLKLAEAENWNELNSDQIKVFYREMIARFGHHLGIEWNISEEFGFTSNSEPQGADPQLAIERIDYLAENDPWQNPRVIHTYPGQHRTKYNGWLSLGAKLTGASIQSSSSNNYKDAYNGNSGILTWINRSKEEGTPWVVASDEQNPGLEGVFNSVEITDNGVTPFARTRILWKTLIAGGQGVMWYGGAQGDFQTENFNRFSTLFDWSRYAILDFFKSNKIEFWKTVNSDNLVSGADNNCLAEAGRTYIIYLENGGTTNLNLNTQTGNYSVKWFNPREGGILVDGSILSVAGGSNVSIGNPPKQTSSDWVALVRLEGTEATPDPIEEVNNTCTFKLEATSTIFTDVNSGIFVESTKNNPLGTLSVDSTRFPDQFAAVTTTFEGIDGLYKLRLNTVAEEDGESTYKVLVNGTEMITFTNPESNEVFEDTQSDLFENITLRTGDEIRVEFNSVSNGKIPEGGGFAYARGRWKSLEIFCPDAIITGPEGTGGRGDLCEYDFEEVDGLAVLEAESIDTKGTQWVRRNEKRGFTGSSYLEWTGNNFFGTPGNGVITAKVKINTPGKYKFVWRTTVGEGTNPTEANDSWLRIPDADDFYGEKPDGSRTYPAGEPRGRTPKPEGAGGAGWFKSYVNNLNWSFQSVTGDNADGRAIFAEFNAAGIYTIELSGRSKHHLIDRIALAKDTNAENTSLAETRCPDANPVPLPPPLPPVIVKNIPGKIEAEDFDTQIGIQAEPTQDTGGGQNIGFIENGDSSSYEVDVKTPGKYIINLRLASNTTGGTTTVKIGSTTLGSTDIENTGDWQVWETKTFEADLPIGRNVLKLEYSGGGGFLFNVNFIEFVLKEAAPIPTIANNNFEIEVIGESCPDSNDGSINVKAKDSQLNYTIKVVKDQSTKTKTFSDQVSITNLEPGKHIMEITVTEIPDFIQRVTLDVKERLPISAKETILKSAKQLTLALSGGLTYQIDFNKKTFFTSDNEFTLDLVNGENNLVVKTDKDCQGSHSSKILIDTNDFSIFPNPVANNLNITLANPENLVSIIIQDFNGKVVKQYTKSGISSKINTDVSALESGVYFVSIQGKNTNENVKIIKK